MKKLIQYECKKILFHNKAIYIFSILFLYVFGMSLYMGSQEQLDAHDRAVYNQYYDILKGDITEDKNTFIENEALEMESLSERIQTYVEDYRADIITEEQYINLKQEQNNIKDRSAVFEDVRAYFEYLKTDNNQQFIDESSVNQLLANSYPLVQIILMGIVIILCLYQEDNSDMYPIIFSTLIGKKKLLQAKILSLCSIFVVVHLLQRVIEIGVIYYRFPLHDITAIISSSRLYEGTSFSNSFILMLCLSTLYQIIAIVYLVFITTFIYQKTKNITVAAISVVSIYILPYFLYGNDKGLYYITFIGYFNPFHYFIGNKYDALGELVFQSFTMAERTFVFGISVGGIIFLICLLFMRKIKYYKPLVITIVSFVLVGCGQNINQTFDGSTFYNTTSISVNETMVTYGKDTFFHIGENRLYSIDRDPLNQAQLDFATGYAYHQYYYFVQIGKGEYYIKRMDSKTFEQENIYVKSLESSRLFQNERISFTNNMPISLVVHDESAIFNTSNGIYKIINNKEIRLVEGETYNLEIHGGILYYINDINQVCGYDLSTQENFKIMDTLVESYKWHNDILYYVSLKDQFLHQYNPSENETAVVIDQSIAFFQVENDNIFFVNHSFENLYKYNKLLNEQEIVLEGSVSEFVIVENRIYFYTSEYSSDIQFYYYDGIGFINISEFEDENSYNMQ